MVALARRGALGFGNGRNVPIGPLEIDWSHPLASGLVISHVGSQFPRCLARPDLAPLTTTAGSWVTGLGPYGLGFMPANSSFPKYDTALLPALTDYTVFAFQSLPGGSTGTGLSGSPIGADATKRVFQFNLTTARVPQSVFFNTAAGTLIPTLAALTADQCTQGWTQSMKISSADNKGYLAANGVVSLGGTLTGTLQAFGTSSSVVLGGVGVGGTNTFAGNGMVYAAHVWTRKIADGEDAWLDAEPFAMYRSMIRRRPYVAGAGVSRALTPNAASAAGSSAATLRRSRALTGAATASSAQTAADSAIRALTAAATASGTSSAALARSRALTAAGTASTSQAASTGRARALTPNPAGAASGQAASEAAVRRMIAAAVAAGSQSGGVTRGRALTGSTTALTTQSGSIAKFTQGQLTGQGLAAGTAAAALHAIRALQGGATAAGAAAGALARSRGLAGAGGAATGTQAATLRRSRQLAPAAGGSGASGQAGAIMAVRGLRMAATAAAVAAGQIQRQRALGAAAASASSTQTATVTKGDLPAPAAVYNIVRFSPDARVLRFGPDVRIVRFTRSEMGKPKSFKRKHPLANPWYGIGLGEPLSGTPSVVASCSVTNTAPLQIASIQIATADPTLVEFQAAAGDDGTLWNLTLVATSALDGSLLAVDVLLPVERHFGG